MFYTLIKHGFLTDQSAHRVLSMFSNYWIRLSRIWRILQTKEGVIHRGRRPRWLTPSEICRILPIPWKPNSIIALLFIQNISPFLKEFRHFALCFSAHQNNTTLFPCFLDQRFNNLQRAALLTSSVQQGPFIAPGVFRTATAPGSEILFPLEVLHLARRRLGSAPTSKGLFSRCVENVSRYESCVRLYSFSFGPFGFRNLGEYLLVYLLEQLLA